MAGEKRAASPAGNEPKKAKETVIYKAYQLPNVSAISEEDLMTGKVIPLLIKQKLARDRFMVFRSLKPTGIYEIWANRRQQIFKDMMSEVDKQWNPPTTKTLSVTLKTLQKLLEAETPIQSTVLELTFDYMVIVSADA